MGCGRVTTTVPLPELTEISKNSLRLNPTLMILIAVMSTSVEDTLKPHILVCICLLMPFLSRTSMVANSPTALSTFSCNSPRARPKSLTAARSSMRFIRGRKASDMAMPHGVSTSFPFPKILPPSVFTTVVIMWFTIKHVYLDAISLRASTEVLDSLSYQVW